MRRTAAMLVAAALLVAGGAAAEAAFVGGFYRGVTERDRPVTFRVLKEKRKVTDFQIRAQYGCTDFDTFWTTEDDFPAMRIRRGRFGGTFETADGSYSVKIKGTLDGRRAKGTYLAERRYDADGNLDPRGRVTCYVTKTSWTAKRRG